MLWQGTPGTEQQSMIQHKNCNWWPVSPLSGWQGRWWVLPVMRASRRGPNCWTSPSTLRTTWQHCEWERDRKLFIYKWLHLCLLFSLVLQFPVYFLKQAYLVTTEQQLLSMDAKLSFKMCEQTWKDRSFEQISCISTPTNLCSLFYSHGSRLICCVGRGRERGLQISLRY